MNIKMNGKIWTNYNPNNPLRVVTVSHDFTDQAYRYMITRKTHLHFGKTPIEIELFPFAVDKNFKIELLKRHIDICKSRTHVPWIIRETKIIIRFIGDHLECLKKRCQILMLKIIG